MKVTYLTAVLLIIALYVHATNSMKDGRKNRRQILIQEIIKKVTNLTLTSFANTSLEDRPQIMKKIKDKLKLASKFAGSRGDKYVELVMDGIQSIVTRSTPDAMNSTVNNNLVDSNIQRFHKYKDTERPTPDKGLRGLDSIAPILSDGSRATDAENNDLSDVIAPSDDATIFNDDICDCSCVEERICSKILHLSKFTCSKDQNLIPIEKLCDGEYDCNDSSDEMRCTAHANQKLSEAKRVIAEIVKILPKRCLEVQISTDKVVMKTQKVVLENVLKKQASLLNVIAPNKSEVNTVQPVVLVVSSVAAALEAALCIREQYMHLFSRRQFDLLDDDFEVKDKQLSWAPPLCTCLGQFCLHTNCTPACNNTCQQRYSLGRWTCAAVDGKRSVSLNRICNGMVDCLDESDENGCTTGLRADKFEATQMYNVVLQVLSTKTGSTEFHPLLHKLISLQNSIKSLQKQTIKEKTDMTALKSWRDEAFSGLVSIYDGVLAKADDIIAVDNVYNFLMSVNHKLVEALKRSKTGNERLLPSNECHCAGDKCLLADCSAKCVRTCAVKAIFTEYSCRGDTHATTPVQNICNGRKECPEGDDEENCMGDICRNHHLVVLRNKMQDYRDDRWGSVFGEAFTTWKKKTISTIRVIEKTTRTNRLGLQKLVAEFLHDLVRTYASLPQVTRRTTDVTTIAFLDFSRLIQDTLRACTN